MAFQYLGHLPQHLDETWCAQESFPKRHCHWTASTLRRECFSVHLLRSTCQCQCHHRQKYLKELAVYYLHYNLQYTPSSLSFWSLVSVSDTWSSMSKNWRTSGDYSLISLLQNLTRRNRTCLEFSMFCCSLTVLWLHIFKFPKIGITLWSVDVLAMHEHLDWCGHYKLQGW